MPCRCARGVEEKGERRRFFSVVGLKTLTSGGLSFIDQMICFPWPFTNQICLFRHAFDPNVQKPQEDLENTCIYEI